MGAYEDELEILKEDLNNNIIDIKEYNKRLKEIEDVEFGERYDR